MSYDDPFGSAPQDQTTSSESTTTTDNPRPAAAVPTEGKVVVTLKGGRDYDAPWIVIHASDLDDANDQMNGKLADLMGRVKRAAATFNGGGATTSAPAQSQSAPAERQAPQAATQAPNGEERFCKHGKMEFRSGKAKSTGKPYELFSCPVKDRDQQCRAQFLN